MKREKAQFTEGIVAIIINSLLFAAKMWAGIITGSIALIADAWHTLSDSISSVIVVIAVKLTSKKADKEHPFGHGRWEYIASMSIAVILGIIAYDFIKNSIVRFRSKESVEYGLIAIMVTIISIVVKELLAQYAFYLGKKTDNAVVKADGWHHRSDALSSVVVLAGILVARFFHNLWWIDSVLGIIIALMLFYATFKIMKDVISKLLGEATEQSLIDKIKNEVYKLYSDSLHLHHFHMHNYVLHKEMTLHMRLNKNKTIEEGHILATAIEEMIEEQFNIVATIHIEPLK